MSRKRTDILGQDGRSGALPFVVAVMSFLALLAGAGGLILNGLAQDWARGLEGALTVEIAAEAARTKGKDELIADTLAILNDTPGVARAQALDNAAMEELIGPWLGPLLQDGKGDGETLGVLDLPLPVLIDVKLEGGAILDLEALNTRLATLGPGVVADDHRTELRRLIDFAGRLELIALGATLLVGIATAIVVAFATRAALESHRPTVETLHIVGATDRAIALEFERQFLRLGFSGGILGMGLGALVLVLAIRTAPMPEPELWNAIGWGGTATLLALPFVMGLIAMVTARSTVISTLKNML